MEVKKFLIPIKVKCTVSDIQPHYQAAKEQEYNNL